MTLLLALAQILGELPPSWLMPTPLPCATLTLTLTLIIPQAAVLVKGW